MSTLKEQVAETWCPECGPHVAIDEDGCCASCGATASGEGAARALIAETAARELHAALREFTSPSYKVNAYAQAEAALARHAAYGGTKP